MSINSDQKSTDLTKISGVAVGIVLDNKDPDGLGRVKLKFPWRDSADSTSWVRLAVPMAGKQMGTYFLPEIGDEVLVAFDHGDIHMPYVIGALWNGQDKPPEANKNGQNDKRMIKSRSGHQLIFSDESGKEAIQVHTKAGHEINLDDSSGSEKIEIKDKTGNNSIVFDSSKNSITIKSLTKISIQAQIIEIKADANLDVQASAALNLKGALVKIN